MIPTLYGYIQDRADLMASKVSTFFTKYWLIMPLLHTKISINFATDLMRAQRMPFQQP